MIVSLKLCILFTAMFALTGCESLIEGLLESNDSSGGGHSRGSLSGAMKASASGSTEPIHGSGHSESHSYSSSDTEVTGAATAGSGGGWTLSGDKDRDFRFQVPVDVAYSVPFNGEFQSITRFTITPICVEGDRVSLGVFVSGDAVGLKPGTLPDNAIDDAWMLEIGLAGRVYFNRAHAFISPYFTASFAGQMLYWDYRHPVYTSDGDKIESDSLGGVGGYAGLGVAFYRSSHFNLFGEAGVGGTVWDAQTTQGFDNDVFHDFGYFSVKAGCYVKF
jgi:hypothetical protein